ncbi:MAG: ABC transporter permease [Spirochaetales bacterium]|nr:ABC transporter permease [Spirochaetales bacterium]
MKISWVLFTASKFLKNRRATRGFATAFLSSGGIAVGVAALVVVLAVMNGFQLGFIEDILGISSYHIRISTPDFLSARTMKAVEETRGVRSIVRIEETQTLIHGELSGLQSCRVRGVPLDISVRDAGFIKQLNIVAGSIDPSISDGIVLGRELASSIAAGPGSTVSLLTLSGQAGSFAPETIDFTVTGIFDCGYYQYDRSMAVVPLAAVERLGGGGYQYLYGVKLDNRNALDRGLNQIEELLAGLPHETVTWRNYNKSFFGALRTEKLVMILLLSLIFLVTGFNTYHSLKRAIFEKREQIAVLRALGARPRDVRRVFILNGGIIGAAGAAAGIVVGLLLAANINNVFGFIETVLNGILGWVSRTLSSTAASPQVAFFSPVYFYLTEVPIRILYLEVAGIFSFGVYSSLAAAHFASKRISEIEPARVLRYE